jgi:hypothetical protein
MGAIIGVLVGYALGTRAGEEGWAEFRAALKVIATSEEVRDFALGGLGIAGGMFGRWREQVSSAMGGSDEAGLRSVA